MKTTKNGKNVNGEDRNRLVFVVVPVEQPDLAERGGGENAVAVVVEENAAFGGGFGVLAEILSAEHIPLYEEKFTQIGVPRWAQIALFGVLSRRGQNKIKVVYDPKRSGIFYVFA